MGSSPIPGRMSERNAAGTEQITEQLFAEHSAPGVVAAGRRRQSLVAAVERAAAHEAHAHGVEVAGQFLGDFEAVGVGAQPEHRQEQEVFEFAEGCGPRGAGPTLSDRAPSKPHMDGI